MEQDLFGPKADAPLTEAPRHELWPQGARALQTATTTGWEPGLVYMIRRAGWLALFALSLAVFCVATVNERLAARAAEHEKIRLAISNARDTAARWHESAILARSAEAGSVGHVAVGTTDAKACELSE